MLLAESVIADLTGDTIGAKFQFDLLFETLSNIDAIESKDEFQQLEMNRLLTASIDYYENESVTIDKIEMGLSVSLLRDRLDKYIYSQRRFESHFRMNTRHMSRKIVHRATNPST